MNPTESYGSVKLSTLKAAIASIEHQNYGRPVNTDNIDITFEYLIGSFFPDIIKNIEKTMHQEYIRGYNDGKADNNGN